MGTLYGAIIGAAAFQLTEEWLSGLTEHWKVIFGPLLIVVVLFARGGLVGLVSQVVRTLRDDPLGRGSAVITRLRAGFVRRVLPDAQGARQGLMVFGGRRMPMVQAITARIATLPPRVHADTERLAAHLTPILQAYREAFARGFAFATKRCADIIRRVSLSTQGAWRSLVRFAARLTPVIQPTTARLATLPPRVHASTERLSARLTPVWHACRESFARGSTLATQLSADIVRRVSLSAQDARRGLVAFAARLAPLIQETTERVARVAAYAYATRNRLASWLSPMLHTYREALPRVTRRLVGEIAGLRSELTRRLRGD
jgi:hypothetical protein